jgi:Golgi nucleoside diphosphatase
MSTLVALYVVAVEVIVHGQSQSQTVLEANYASYETNNVPSSASHHYAVVIDAGSSGSRAFLYYWPSHSGFRDQLIAVQPLRNLTNMSPLHKTIKPGLSSLAATPETVTEYLAPLLDFASNFIPAEKISETPLYVFATAGMRLLKTSEQNAILHNMRQGVPKRYNFFFPPGNVEIITGRQEGIFQWTSVNYVLGLLKPVVGADDTHSMLKTALVESSLNSNIHLRRQPTAGILDMGGASLQIAFEVPTAADVRRIRSVGPKEGQMMEINLGPFENDPTHMFRVFVTTYLGFGANEKMRHHREVLFTSQLGAARGRDEKNG